jgi:hypothetical protein
MGFFRPEKEEYERHKIEQTKIVDDYHSRCTTHEPKWHEVPKGYTVKRLPRKYGGGGWIIKKTRPRKRMVAWLGRQS